MAKKQRNRENAFRMSKEKAEKEYLIFTEVFKLPFYTKDDITSLKESVLIYSENEKARFNPILIRIPEELLNDNSTKLLKKICSILNGEKVKLNLKNIRFNYNDSGSNCILINNDPFIKIVNESVIKDYMESNNIRGYRSAKTIRRSLMYYIVKKLNESLI
jgi:hypothetical protein